MNRAPALPSWYQAARMWAPRSDLGGVQWRCLMRGRVMAWERRAEARFALRFALVLGIAPAPINELIHLLRMI